MIELASPVQVEDKTTVSPISRANGARVDRLLVKMSPMAQVVGSHATVGTGTSSPAFLRRGSTPEITQRLLVSDLDPGLTTRKSTGMIGLVENLP